MRDLEQYLPSFKKEKYLQGRSGHDTESESVTIEAIERAIKAEAAYKRILHEWNFNNEDVKKLQEEIEAWRYEEGVQRIFNVRLEAENAKLRKVVDAAKEWINCPCEDIQECLECTAFKYRNALAELDEDTNGR